MLTLTSSHDFKELILGRKSFHYYLVCSGAILSVQGLLTALYSGITTPGHIQGTIL